MHQRVDSPRSGTRRARERTAAARPDPRATLAELELGARARVVQTRGAGGSGDLSLRLMEMGFVPGTVVTLIKRAPLGYPLELRVRGSHVSLRRAEARLVEVEMLERPGASA